MTAARDMTKDLLLLHQHNDFWTVARNDIFLKRIVKSPVIDVGCGTGDITKMLIGKGMDVYSFDIDESACEYTKRFNKKTFKEDFTKIDTAKLKVPLFQSAIMADSLEHMSDDVVALKHINKLLHMGGSLFISVPCGQWLWTKNDTVRHHFRRYSKRLLQTKLARAGFETRRIRYWNFLSLPAIIMGKLFARRVPHESISTSRLNKILTRYFLSIENRIPVPYGSELICEARKIKDVER